MINGNYFLQNLFIKQKLTFYQYILMVKMELCFIYFASKNQNQTLKYSSYIHETKKRLSKEISIYFGEKISYEDISHLTDRKELINYLKETTYSLKNKI